MTFLCTTSTSSYITRATHIQHLRAYPYDHTLYHPRIACRTCAFAKPARSKHCSICGVCVARADHHCAWVNNCIGRANYAWFVALVASLGTVLSYGTGLALLLLAPRVTPAADNEHDTLRAWTARWFATITAEPILGGVGLLAALTAPLAWGLLAYHAYLIWAGMTTNETDKWGALRDEMAAGKVWRGSRAAVLGADPVKRSHGARLFAESETQQWAAPPLTPLFERDEEEAAESGSGSDADSLAGGESSAAMAARDAEQRWPLAFDQIVVRTRDGKAPVMPGRRRVDAARGRGWTQVWRLEQIENLYDLGFAGNVRELLFPGPLPEAY